MGCPPAMLMLKLVSEEDPFPRCYTGFYVGNPRGPAEPPITAPTLRALRRLSPLPGYRVVPPLGQGFRASSTHRHRVNLAENSVKGSMRPIFPPS